MSYIIARKQRRRPLANPWGLTAIEVQTVESLIAHGQGKAVARHLGIGLSTYEARMERVRRQMRTHTTGDVVAWALWAAKQEQA